MVVTGGPSVSAAGLTHSYGHRPALDDVTFELASARVGLVGVNGAGKSTLMKALAGALRPGHGRVAVDGHDIYGSRGERRSALGQVAFVPQLPVFPKNLTAIEVVSYLAWVRGTPARQVEEHARRALAQVGLGDRGRAKIGALSGGMLRRVAVAQALASEPAVLLLDEPTTGLDPQQRRSMVDLLGSLRGTVLISSHVMEDVADLAERVLVLDQGRLLFDGLPSELAARAPEGTPEHRQLEAGFLSLCVRADR